jgi:hypothetical protein
MLLCIDKIKSKGQAKLWNKFFFFFLFFVIEILDSTCDSSQWNRLALICAFNPQVLVLGNERFSVPELIFSPSDVGLNQMGVGETIVTVVEELCPEVIPTFSLSVPPRFQFSIRGCDIRSTNQKLVVIVD